MTTPRWTRALLRRLAPRGRADDLIGDLEEAHRRRLDRRGRLVAHLLTSLEALELASALIRGRLADRAGPSWIDLKLGFRMLVKYPGITVVGGLAMAFAIWVGAVGFEVVNQIVRPQLPLEDGEKIVGVQNGSADGGLPTAPELRDFVRWRERVQTIRELGAFRTVSRNLVSGDGDARAIVVAEITAAGLGVARVAPLEGRTLLDSDELPGAFPVVVLGFDVWRSRFQSDPDIVGRTVNVGRVTSTVVGVMPEGFTFPVSHDAWVPLRRPPVGVDPGATARVAVFGRLGPDVTLESAQSELEALGVRREELRPGEAARIRPRVMAFARSVAPLPDIGSLGLAAVNLFLVTLLILICGNVGLLVFARAATRERELAVRSALGASRARIVFQLFVEALVLGGVAAVVGLVGAGFGVKWFVAMSEADSGGRLPFWMHGGLAPTTVLYVCGLTLLASAAAGVGPALRVTGRRVESRLRRMSTGITGLRLGRGWTAVIVAQVAVTVAFPATAFFFQRYVEGIKSLDLGFAAEEYLSARLEMDEGDAASVAEELRERLREEPAVAGVTFADRMPGTVHPTPRVEVEGVEPGPGGAPAFQRASRASVEADFLDVLGAPVLAGRRFDSGDATADPGVVIVNEHFVDHILAGRNPVGRRLRYLAPDDLEPGPWYEIVGVTANLGMLGGNFDPEDPGVYHPRDPDASGDLQMAVRVRGDPPAFVPRLRALAAAVDPGLRLHDVGPMDRVSESLWRESEFLYQLLAGVSAVALLLSMAGIYSVTSFAVSRRTREIGVRLALGSSPRSIIAAIFVRPVSRVAVGTLLGGVLVYLSARGLTGPMSVGEVGLVALYATLMLCVCTLACAVPTRRALRVEPTEALRAPD